MTGPTADRESVEAHMRQMADTAEKYRLPAEDCSDLRDYADQFSALLSRAEKAETERDRLSHIAEQYREKSNEQFHRANRLESELAKLKDSNQ